LASGDMDKPGDPPRTGGLHAVPGGLAA
jgi:hypothetical protein